MKTQKYLAINLETKEEFLCEKVEIEGFDYYVSDEQANENFYGYINFQGGDIKKIGKYFADDWKKVIATTNPNLPIPKVVDEVEFLVIKDLENYYGSNLELTEKGNEYVSNFIQGYKKAKEEFKWSDKDMIEFAEFRDLKLKEFNEWALNGEQMGNRFSTKELLELWQSQKPIKIYFK